jgi:hypothetical protein
MSEYPSAVELSDEAVAISTGGESINARIDPS